MVFRNLIVGLLLAGNVLLQAQNARPAYGVMGNVVLSQHNTDFRAFPGIPSCCPLYDGGSGTGIAAGIVYEMPLGESLRLALRGGYSSFGGTLIREENTTGAENVPVTYEHRVQATMADAGIEPLVQYQPFSSLPAFSLNAGVRLGFLLSKTFSQKESITQPSNGLFIDGSSTRNEYNHLTIPNAASILASVLVGLSYDLPLNTKGTMILAPEFLYSLALTPVAKDFSWNVNAIRIGASIKYSPLPHKEPLKRIEQKRIIDTLQREAVIAKSSIVLGKESVTSSVKETEEEILTIETMRRTDTLLLPRQNILKSAITANAVEGDGSEKAVGKIIVEEFTSTLLTPLLNYVFFEENSVTIPQRYKLLQSAEVAAFREENVNDPDRLQTYHQVLNIIGKRMQNTPSAVLSLVGYNTDFGAEKGNTELSKRRAEAVKSYFVEKWGIAEKRITIQTRNLSDKAANSLSSDGAQENRRVEIIASDNTITAPLITNDTLRTVSPHVVRFHPQITSDQPLAQWSLAIKQGGKTLKSFEAKGAIPETLDWNLQQEESSRPKSSQPLSYVLNATTTLNDATKAENSLPVEQITVQMKRSERRADKEINRYSMVLFDVRSTEVTAANKTIIEIIKKDITPASTVYLTGYTDRSGDLKTNQVLAEGRAQNTAKALGVYVKPENIQGVANATTYNPDLPEGRIYTRTVDVIIETPIQNK